METLERSRVCRLCGKQAVMTINIFAKREKHVKKINMILPMMVHEMDLLPKHMCHPCNYKLQEFHKFYEDCLKTDADLKSQLSWMQRSGVREEIIIPMVHINNVKIKTEPLDYEEPEVTSAILNGEKITNFSEHHYTAFDEKFVEFSGSRDLSRSRCYCGNYKNHSHDLNTSNCSKRKSEMHSSVTKDNAENSPRDLIRRNLFATEIFGATNPRLQVEIPMFDVSKRFFNEKRADEFESLGRLNRFGAEQNGGAVKPKIEVAEVPTKISSRTLRPRTRIVNASSRSSSDPPKRTMGKSTGREVVQRTEDERRRSHFDNIKMEVSESLDRNLRPRSGTINYSDLKRKNPLARNSDNKREMKKIKTFPDHSENEKPRMNIATDRVTLAENKKLQNAASSQILVVKLERDDCLNYANHQSSIPGANKKAKTSVKPKNNQKNTPDIVIKRETVSGDNAPEIHSIKSMKTSVKQELLEGSPKDKQSQRARGKSLVKNHPNPSHCLRSQIQFLRNGKPKKSDSLVDGLKARKRGDSSPRPSSAVRRRFPLDFIKEKRNRMKNKSSAMILKNQHCNSCKKRFASPELYKLHDCYTS